MLIYVDVPTIVGGMFLEVSHLPQNVPDHIAQQLIQLGNGRPYETKVVKPEVTKEKKSSASSQQAQASQESKPKKRGRPRKQPSS